MVLLFLWVPLIILTIYIAAQKHRSMTEGFILGLVFGPIGAIVEVCLPTLEPPKTTYRRASSRSEGIGLGWWLALFGFAAVILALVWAAV